MKYSKASSDQISKSRLRLGNPLAHIGDNDGFDAIISEQIAETAYNTASAKQISESRLRYGNQYAHVAKNNGFEAITSEPLVDNVDSSIQIQNSSIKENNPYSWIESIARDLQIKIWNEQNQLWPEGAPQNPVDLLDPSKAINKVGYDFILTDTLGESDFDSQGTKGEIAGILDRVAKRVSISRRLPNVSFRFTAAHELGHILLHKGTSMHRDRPIDGSRMTNVPREKIEIEADKFAVYFLMPEKLVRERFHEFYGMDAFILTEDTAFAFARLTSDSLIRQYKSRQNFIRAIANKDIYNGERKESLASQFNVSVGAMAIRIEELGLVRF